MWPITLSGRLRIVALVGRYPTNKLIRRGPIYQQQLESEATFEDDNLRHVLLFGISTPLGVLSPTERQVTHVLLTGPPLYSPSEEGFLVRLA